MFNKGKYANEWIKRVREVKEMHDVALEAIAIEGADDKETCAYLISRENDLYNDYIEGGIDRLRFYGFSQCEIDIIRQLAEN